mmetsp:Transcript_36685/g.78268  ORF Transcript_36685/g.78268 Transcript_36685/m.78268 type:complete len:208 (-) Transcript_36685:111-734(-)
MDIESSVPTCRRSLGFSLLRDLNAHVAGCTLNRAHGRLNLVGVQIGKLDLCNLLNLRLGHGSSGRGATPEGYPGTFGDTSRLLQEFRSWRCLQDETEAPVVVHGYLDRDNCASLISCASVVLLAEHHDVDSSGAEGGTDRWGRVGLASLKRKLDELGNLFRHHNRLRWCSACASWQRKHCTVGGSAYDTRPRREDETGCWCIEAAAQ